ncbi:MAG: calcium/sodium antiporter [Patescibacteria group bacterium]|nr:calcium/sodium antiporter [Patescibacteria group bacterium]
MLPTVLLFLLGLGLLVKGADVLVDGASSLARRLGVSALVIGLTIVAFGTSAPELVVNLVASLNGNTDISIGNILGSNIVNVLFILGLSAVIYPLGVKTGTVWREIPLSFLAALLVAILANDALIDGGSASLLTRIDGLVLISFFIIFLYYCFGVARAEPADDKTIVPRTHSLPRSLIMILGGLAGLVLGGRWVVSGAVEFAVALGLSEALVGLIIVAVGTSLPELFTSAVAAYKKDTDIAVGNVVGSNIFNIFFVLGTSAVIYPLPFSSRFMTDALVMLAASLLVFMFMFVGKKHMLERWQGAAFMLLYVAYVVYTIGRG